MVIPANEAVPNPLLRLCRVLDGEGDAHVDVAGFARRYGSARHVSRVHRMHDRLSETPIGSSVRMRDLADALRAA